MVNEWPPKRRSSRSVVRRKPRAATWLAWSVCALSFALTVLGLLFLVASRSPIGAPVYAGAPVFDFWLENALMGITFSAVGAVIAPYFPAKNPIGWLFCAIGLIGGMRLFVAEYAIVTLLAEPGSVAGMLPGGEALAWVSSWLWVPHIGLFAFLGLLFPDGRPPSARWQLFVWLVGVVTVAGTVAVALWPETVGGLDLKQPPRNTKRDRHHQPDGGDPVPPGTRGGGLVGGAAATL